MREQRRTERRLARLAKAQAKRTEAATSQSAQEPTQAVAAVPGLPAASAPPEQFQNYLVCGLYLTLVWYLLALFSMLCSVGQAVDKRRVNNFSCFNWVIIVLVICVC